MKNLDEQLMANLIGQELRRLRESAGWSQTQFAILSLGYNKHESYAGQAKISKIETGKQTPPFWNCILSCVPFM